MKPRILFSICIGIIQFFALFFLVPFLANFLEANTGPWMISEDTALIVGLLAICIVYLPYPIYLFHKNQKADAMITFGSSAVCTLLWMAFFYQIVRGLSVID